MLAKVLETYIAIEIIIAFSNVISPADLANILVLLLRYLFQ